LFLDGAGLSLKALQSINIFTVGGTAQRECHGIAHDPGLCGADGAISFGVAERGELRMWRLRKIRIVFTTLSAATD